MKLPFQWKPLHIFYTLCAAVALTTRFNGINVSYIIREIIFAAWLIFTLSLIANKKYRNGHSNDVLLCGKHLVYMFMPYAVIFIYTVFVWAFDSSLSVSFRNFTRLVSTNLYLFLACSFAAVGFILFRKKVMNLLFIAATLSYCFASIVPCIIKFGFSAIVLYGKELLGFASATPINYYMEVHDITFAFGVFLLYFLFWGQRERHRLLKILISCLFIFLGLKRIEILALGIAIALYSLCGIKKLVKARSIICFCIATTGAYVFVYLISSNLLPVLADRFGIETSGRLDYYDYATNYFDFSLGYLGKGFTWFSRMFQQLYLSGFRINGLGIAASVHSNILELYIELGFWGLLVWLFYTFYIRTKKISRFGTKAANAYLLITFYMFVLYLTDNTLTYSVTQLVYFLVPLVLSMDNKDATKKIGHQKSDSTENGALFLCRTPYQIIAAAQIKNTQYKNEECGIVIFDTIANHEVLVKNMEEGGFFANIYSYSIGPDETRSDIAGKIKALFYKPRINVREKYSAVYIANAYDWVSNAIIKRVRKTSGHELSVYMYEDGFATYSALYGNFFKSLLDSNVMKRLYYKILYSEYLTLKGLFLFSPELAEWKPSFEIKPIPKIDPNDHAFLKTLNTIFGYRSSIDIYEQKYIFFEESYFADGLDINDTEVVNKIAEVVGKENIFVKIHPRNKVNRFQKLGYVTNQNTEIPWEIIALNIPISEKVLLTIASGSALTSLVNMSSVPKKIVMLMNCKEIDDSKLTSSLHSLRTVASLHRDTVCLPDSFDEAIELLQEETKL